jgi:hypothetical protein
MQFNANACVHGIICCSTRRKRNKMKRGLETGQSRSQEWMVFGEELGEVEGGFLRGFLMGI